MLHGAVGRQGLWMSLGTVSWGGPDIRETGPSRVLAGGEWPIQGIRDRLSGWQTLLPERRLVVGTVECGHPLAHGMGCLGCPGHQIRNEKWPQPVVEIPTIGISESSS